MKLSITKQIAAGLGIIAALSVGAGVANADTGVITWRGNVDSVARITIRGQNVSAFALSGKGPSNVSVRRTGDDFNGRSVSLVDTQGRGSVQIVQSPNRSNNYTTIVEVRDPEPGDSQYQFRLRSSDGFNGRNDDRRDDRNDNDRRGNGGNGRWGDNRGDNNGRWGNNGNNGRNDRDDRDNRGNGRNDRDNRHDTSLPSDLTLRVAYLLGVQQGKKDNDQRLSRDYSRYRNRFNDRTESDFRRGYDNGFYGYDSPRDRH